MKKKNVSRLTQIGGGSTYTPDFAQLLIEMKDEFSVDEWILMDIDAERNEIVGNFTRTMLEDAGIKTKITLESDLDKAVKGADFVITTIRVGGSQGRIYDEVIPPKHGFLLGQETTPPGGLMMGLRTIPVILDVAKSMEKYAKPDAWLINLSNPSGMLVEAVNQHSPINFAGLCNGPTVARNAMVEALGAKKEDVLCKIIGLNHLIWMKVYLEGKDITDKAIRKLDSWYAKNLPAMKLAGTPLDIQEFCGWIPIGPYLKYYYLLPEVIEDQANIAKMWPKYKDMLREQIGILLDDADDENMKTRAHMVRAIEKKTLELYAKGDYQGYELTRHSRGGRGYGEAGIALASAIWNDKYEIQGPDVRSMGSIPGLDPNVVATTTALITRSGIYPLCMEEMPPHMMAFIQSAKKYELLAVEAAVTGDYKLALEAMIADPLVVSFYHAKKAFDELLIAHKEFLPKFADSIGKLERGENPLK